MSDLYVGAYWGPRKENIDCCTNRIITCLAGVAACDDVFATWYEKGKSRSDASAKVINPASRDSIIRLLEAERSRRDVDRSVMDDLGFRVGLWNGGRSERAVAIGVSCGIYAQTPGLRNSVVLDLPKNLGNLAHKDRCSQLLESIVKAWEPEWAGVISRSSRNARPFDPAIPFVDWIFYINSTDVDPVKLPPATSVKVIDNMGTILVVQDRPIDPANPADLANVEMIRVALGIATKLD